MAERPSIEDPRIRLFWDNYLKRIHKKAVHPPFDRWFVKRAEEYLAASPKRLPGQRPEDVDTFFRAAGRKEGLKDWQFRQIVDAIQNLLEQARVGWLAEVDWDFWRDSARKLDKSHSTVARSYDRIERPAEEPAGPAVAKATLNEIRRAHAPLVDSIRTTARRRGLAIRTEQTYEHWILRFIAFQGGADPKSLGPSNVAAFLDYLALRRNVAASTQNLALNAVVFLFRDIFGQEDADFGDFARAKRPKRLPTVLERAEVAALMGQLEGAQRLMVGLMYGTGMRLMECVRLRVQDIDFGYRQITVRAGKGGKDRVVPLPAKAVEPLRAHLVRVKTLHDEDLEQGFGEVYLPDAFARKAPNAA